jgi:uncharacterized protein (DUF2147 family)
MLKIVLATAVFLAHTVALAQATPAGLWKTIDDETKKEKSLIRISESGGVFTGKLEKFLDPETKADVVCDKCSDERKDKPIMGMTIIRSVKKNADEAAQWDGGDILDPNKGKVYKVLLKPIEGGKKMELRAYIGAPILGRTQTWIRVE